MFFLKSLKKFEIFFCIRKCMIFLFACCLLYAVTPAPAYAATNASMNTILGEEALGEAEKVEVDLGSATGEHAAKELKKVVTNADRKGLLDITERAGFLILVIGIGQMLMAFKDDNADAKARSTTVILAGIFLIGVAGILTQLGAM